MSGKSVGVIIPIYNTSKYLDKCLNYIYSQTYQNIKIMLINDGSTDKKVDEVMEDYANYDDYIEANHPTSIENYNLQNKIIISNKEWSELSLKQSNTLLVDTNLQTISILTQKFLSIRHLLRYW